MTGQFLQSTSSQFLSLKDGLANSVSGAKTRLENLIKDKAKVKLDICKLDTKSLIKQIEGIIRQLEAITKIINSILTVLKKILTFIEFVQKLVMGILVLIQIVKFFPVPAMFTPIGAITTMSDVLAKLTYKVAAALLIITGLDFIINYISISLGVLVLQINSILQQLRFLDQQLQSCIIKKTEFTDDDKLKLALSKSLNTTIDNLSIGLDNLNNQLGSLLKSNNSYKGFTFQIIEESTIAKVKRRYAIALNTTGIVSLTGELSYATDTQVLIDELKQIIDEKNLSGFPPQSNSISTSSDITSQTAKDFGITDSSDSALNLANARKELDNFINSNSSFRELKSKIKF